ncbi:hypothetical protein JTB14_026556 [Gonioctena quinquepunctata]|nr:hypothetical protein JTB14_026556 [Gonioctena quinquepunctata]
MIVNRLVQDELAYESQVRGIGVGTVEEMRHRLSMAIQMEKSGDSLKYPSYPFTVQQDLDAVADKLIELEPKAEQYSKNLQGVPPQLSILDPGESTFQSGVVSHRRSSGLVATAAGVSSVPPNSGSTLKSILPRRAYQFYLAYRHEVDTWDDFVLLLREEFLSADYNEKLFEEIRRRTQGPDESIGIYLAVMSGYFKRLTCPMSEDAKLKILLRNIAPFYQSQLGLANITSISELLALGRRLEIRKVSIENFSAPTRKSSVLEPDLAYVSILEEGPSDVGAVSARPPGSSTDNTVCFRCNQPGHRAIGCATSKGKLMCYGCKREDDRGKSVGSESSVNRLQALLDFVLDNAIDDERPYLRVDILGKTLMGLLDSGASRTILGGKGFELIEDLGLVLDKGQMTTCTVANGNKVQSVGR